MVVKPFQLSFSHRLSYDGESAIIVPILLSSDPATIAHVDAAFDTGSTFCVFQRFYTDLLGLELERGLRKRIRTTTGAFTAYGHEVSLMVEGLPVAGGRLLRRG